MGVEQGGVGDDDEYSFPAEAGRGGWRKDHTPFLATYPNLLPLPGHWYSSNSTVVVVL